MIRVLVSFKHRCPGVWNLVEGVNGALFRLFFGDISAKAETVLQGNSVTGCNFSVVSKEDLPALEDFLQAQPAENLRWFNPHGFDLKTILKLYKNPAFLMMKVCRESDGAVVGYFFLRCFFIGRAFAGLIVSPECQNQGIGSRIWKLQSEICTRCRLKMRATISSDNKPSVASCHNGTAVTELQKMEDGYLAVECKSKNQQ